MKKLKTWKVENLFLQFQQKCESLKSFGTNDGIVEKIKSWKSWNCKAEKLIIWNVEIVKVKICFYNFNRNVKIKIFKTESWNLKSWKV